MKVNQLIIAVLLIIPFYSLNQTSNCVSIKEFGDIKVCLPEMVGMVECYSDPRVKAHSDQFRYEANEIIGMYFNDATFARADELGNFTYDDYFKLYSVIKLKNMDVGRDELDQMTEILKGTYVNENWEEMKSEIEEDYDYITLDQPLLIKTLKPSEDLRSLVFLMKMQAEDFETVVVMTINITLIKSRMIFFAYYKKFEGEESINAAENKSLQFGERLLKVN